MPTVDLAHAIGLEPAEAVAYFESKGYALGFKWQDVWAEAQARAFTVAGVLRQDILQDVRSALGEAIKGGETLAQFQGRIQPVLEAKGWWGKGLVFDQETGEISGKALNPRRLKTIFQTNMQSAYQAGRFKQQLANAGLRPYWEYVAVLDNRTRPHHASQHGRVFRYDDPYWATFYPPNGWNCRCRVRTRSARDVERLGLTPSSSAGRLAEVDQIVDRQGNKRPAIAYKDPATDKNFTADPGFGFNAGQVAMRPFTPPPLDDLPVTFPHGVELPTLPTPTPVSASRLLPEGLPAEEYAAAFLDEFDMKLGESQVFHDVSGSALAINDDLFKTAAGQWKADRDGRGPYMRLLADAVRAPDEIWLRWEASRTKPDAWLLKRRYIKAWEIEGDDGPQFGLSVFEQGENGWTGSTAMMANADRGLDSRQRYIERQRDGFLLYRKN